MSNTNKLVIISAPSGAGKSTIISYLLQQDFGLEFSISATTRQPRGMETNGVEYYFLSIDDFTKKIEQNAFVEFEQVYEGRYYGTLQTELNRIWAKGNTVLFDVDVQGGINLKKQFKEQAISIFIQPPSIEVLRQRLVNRSTDSKDEIEKRVAKAALEMTFASQFDYVIVNDNLDDAKKQAVALLEDFLR